MIIGSRSKKSNKLQLAADRINQFMKCSNTKSTNKCIAITLNIRSSESIKEFFKTLSAEHQIEHINYLVNNAGGQFMSPLHSIKEKGWKSVIDLNLNGTFLISNFVFNTFWKRRSNGHEDEDKVIINITANSFVGMPMMAHSGSARAGVEHLTVAMAQNWSQYGVRANSVAPGFIETTGLDSYPKAYQRILRTHSKDNYMYRMGTVEEVSNAVLFLLSEGASFITGTCLRVDGGESIYNPMWPPQRHRPKKSKL